MKGTDLRMPHKKGGVFIFGMFFVSFLDFFCFSWLLASGFCGFWLLWLLASVASASVYTYLFIYLSFFLLAAVLLSLFVFAFPVVFVAETKQASKQARAAHLWIWCAAGGGAAPPPNPPRATKSALHPRHPRLPRNQYFKVNSPVQNCLTKQICLLYLSI